MISVLLSSYRNEHVCMDCKNIFFKKCTVVFMQPLEGRQNSSSEIPGSVNRDKGWHLSKVDLSQSKVKPGMGQEMRLHSEGTGSDKFGREQQVHFLHSCFCFLK